MEKNEIIWEELTQEEKGYFFKYETINVSVEITNLSLVSSTEKRSEFTQALENNLSVLQQNSFESMIS